MLVNRLGRRYTDEALGRRGGQPDDAAPAGRARRAAVRRRRAPRARGQRAVPARPGHRPLRARPLAGRADHARRRRVEALVAQVGAWGVDTAGARRRRSTPTSTAGRRTRRSRRPNPLREPPFWAVEFQPTITFSLGGVRVDPWGRVLDRDGGGDRGPVLRRRRRRRPAGPALRRGADARDGLRPAGRGGM